MSAHAVVAPAARRRALAGRRVRQFLRLFRTRLRDRRFWVVQSLVIGISLGHSLLESTSHLGVLPDLALLPVSTYFIPVVYAALNFGVEGAVPTALWSAVLTIPNLILWHTGAQRPGVILQLALLVVIAYVIARRVDKETAAKERAEEYIRLATDAQEEERKRLARELHDDTIQALAVVKAKLETLCTEERAASPELCSKLREVDETLATTIDGVRRFSRDLRPSLLDDLGLVHAIDWLVADLAARTGIEALLRTRGAPRRLDQRDELALFRIVQEALSNVEHHSGAGTVKVAVHFGDGVRATVVDDGAGFDLATTLSGRDPSLRLGLLGMRERAKLAGAALSIKSRPGAGTRVTVALPNGVGIFA
jgi:two-component system sensor histidine kinase DegS